MLAHLAAIMVVAATTTGVFFGVAFVLLQPIEKPTVGRRLVRASSAAFATMPAGVLPAARNIAKAAPTRPAEPTRQPAGSPATPPRVDKLPAPKAAAVSPPAVGAAGPEMRAAARSVDDQAAGLLQRGDAFLRAGDIASARLFYERAANGGDGEAALRAGATFDPTFLASIGLRGMRGDPARALDWYRRALALGASNAEPYLHRLESR